MDTLKSFLKENVQSQKEYEFQISKRFLDDYEKPIKWKLQTITTTIDEEIRKICYKQNDEFDYNKYLGKLSARCVLFPNLKSANLQDNYNTKSDDDLLKAMLLPGEYSNLISIVQNINGFDENFESLVDIAKN